jgi:hypothetical protein
MFINSCKSFFKKIECYTVIVFGMRNLRNFVTKTDTISPIGTYINICNKSYAIKKDRARGEIWYTFRKDSYIDTNGLILGRNSVIIWYNNIRFDVWNISKSGNSIDIGDSINISDSIDIGVSFEIDKVMYKFTVENGTIHVPHNMYSPFCRKFIYILKPKKLKKSTDWTSSIVYYTIHTYTDLLHIMLLEQVYMRRVFGDAVAEIAKVMTKS